MNVELENSQNILKTTTLSFAIAPTHADLTLSQPCGPHFAPTASPTSHSSRQRSETVMDVEGFQVHIHSRGTVNSAPFNREDGDNGKPFPVYPNTHM